MGSIGTQSVPRFDLGKDPKSLQPGTQEWEILCQSVRAALEEHGCILVNYDQITGETGEELVAAMKTVFDLPAETKCKNASLSPYFTYVSPNEAVPYYEATSVMNAALPEEAEAFTELMWANGNEKFCRTFNSTSKKLLALAQTITDVIVSSYGVDRCKYPHFASTNALSRMTKYSAPAKGEPALGLPPHIDGSFLTILCQNEVDGLMLKRRDGEWMQVSPGQGSFVVFVGQPLKAWSNGRLYAPLHKVTISGDKDRYTFSLFFLPREDQTVEAPRELIDDEHPAAFRPFMFRDFLEHSFVTHAVEGTLEGFAGI